VQPVTILRLPGWAHPMLQPFPDGSYVTTGGRALWRVVASRPAEQEIDLAPVAGHSEEALKAYGTLSSDPAFPRDLPLPYEVVAA
jgi:hypothetical protein